MDAIDSLVRARMAWALETDRDGEESAGRLARSKAALHKAITDQVRDYRGRIAKLEAGPNGAEKNAPLIRFLQEWIDENSAREDEPQLSAAAGNPSHRPDAGVQSPSSTA